MKESDLSSRISLRNASGGAGTNRTRSFERTQPGALSVRLPVLLVLACALICRPSEAQSLDGDPSPSSTPPDTSAASPSAPSESKSVQPISEAALSLWVGGAFSTGEIIGNTSEGQFGLLALRYNRTFPSSASPTGSDGSTVTYTADLFPVVFLSIPQTAIPDKGASSQRDGSESTSSKQRLDTYGVGANPAGLRINYASGQPVQPFIAGSGGFVYFFRPVPDERGKHLNFTFDVGVGVQVVLSTHTTLTIGYRYQHLSNAFRGQINPGVDANLFYLGISASQ